MENTVEKKKIVLSAIQPTGTPTLGNYLGALKNWKNDKNIGKSGGLKEKIFPH